MDRRAGALPFRAGLPIRARGVVSIETGPPIETGLQIETGLLVRRTDDGSAGSHSWRLPLGRAGTRQLH